MNLPDQQTHLRAISELSGPVAIGEKLAAPKGQVERGSAINAEGI